MTWNIIDSKETLDKIQEESTSHPVLIFKHSTRCSISSVALNRLEKTWDQQEMGATKPYLLDLIRFREISNQIAETYQIRHQSPQVLVINNKEAFYNNSHFEINYNEIRSFAFGKNEMI